jgi:hypothetical protein
MFKDKGPLCPLLKSSCVEAKCMFWTHVRGTSPQGGEVDMPDCAIKWLPMLLIEGSKVGRETGAAVESFRNEMVKSNAIALTLQAKSQGLLK